MNKTIVLMFVFALVCVLTSLSVISIEPPILVTEGVNLTLDLDGSNIGLELLWRNPIIGGSDEFGSVVVENHIMYLTSKNVTIDTQTENITALNVSTGDIIWTTNIGSSDSTPLIDDGSLWVSVYNSATKNGIYKINKTNGSIICENHTCSTGSPSGHVNSQTQSDYMVYTGCMSGVFYAYNKTDCSVVWSYNASGELVNTPLYYSDRVVFGSDEGSETYYQLNATTGKYIWNNSDLKDVWDVQFSYKDDIVYAGGKDGSTNENGVIALNFTNGSTIWENNVVNYVYTQSAIYDNRIWVGTSPFLTKATLYSLNIDDGTENCSYNIGDWGVYQGPSISNDLVFIGTTGSSSNPQIAGMYIFNATDCSIIMNYTFRSIYNAPAISQGRLYFKSDDRNVYAFNLGDGTEEWSHLGYNSTGTSYCEDCLTDFQFVDSVCGLQSGGNYSCNVTNTYDRKVNVTLNVGTTYNWYNLSELLEGSLTNPTFEFNIGEIKELILELSIPDTTQPSFSNNQTNESSPFRGDVIQINLTIFDDFNISAYVLTHNDISSGAFTNETIVDTVGDGNVTMIWNYTIDNFQTGGTFVWSVWANDTNNNVNVSQTFSFIIGNSPIAQSNAEIARNAVVASIFDAIRFLPIMIIVLIGGIIVVLFINRNKMEMADLSILTDSETGLHPIIIVLIAFGLLVVIAILILNQIPTTI